MAAVRQKKDEHREAPPSVHQVLPGRGAHWLLRTPPENDSVPLGRGDLLRRDRLPVARGLSRNGRFHVWDKLQHFGAYQALSFLPVVGFRDRHKALVAGLSMFFLGGLLELGQHFSPGRAVELGDVLANGAGVTCGALLAFRFAH